MKAFETRKKLALSVAVAMIATSAPVMAFAEVAPADMTAEQIIEAVTAAINDPFLTEGAERIATAEAAITYLPEGELKAALTVTLGTAKKMNAALDQVNEIWVALGTAGWQTNFGVERDELQALINDLKVVFPGGADFLANFETAVTETTVTYNAFTAMDVAAVNPTAANIAAAEAAVAQIMNPQAKANATARIETEIKGQDLAVTSVSAIDATEIKVVFNKAMGPSAATITNYSIDTVALAAPDTATLSADKKSVILNIASTGALSNNTAYTISVDKGVKDVDGNALSATTDYTTGLYFSDHAEPTIESVVTESNGDLKINFSEKVADNSSNIIVNGISVTPSAVVDNTVTITKANLAAANLEKGKSYSIYISGYDDLVVPTPNSMDLYTGTFTYNIISDVTAPTVVSLVAKDESTLTLTFSEKINGATDTTGVTDYATLLGLSVKKGVAATVMPTTATTEDGKVFTLNLPTGANVLYDGTATPKETSANLAVTVMGYKDLALNIGTQVNKTITVNKDVTGPVFTNAEYDLANTNFVFTVNEGLAASVAPYNTVLTVVDEDGVLQTVTATPLAISAGDKEVVFDNTALGYGPGTYTFTIAKSAITDEALNGGNGNALYTATVVVPTGAADSTAPTATVTSGTKDVITVTYDEAVKGGNVAGSATDVANYKINGAALPAGTFITLNAGKTIATITMPAGSVVKSETVLFNIANVQDLAGNAITTVNKTLALTDSIEPVLQSANYDSNTGEILLTFSEDVTGVVAGDLNVEVNGTTATIAIEAALATDTAKQVRISSSDASFATGTVTISTIASTPTGADAAGNTLKEEVTVNLVR